MNLLKYSFILAVRATPHLLVSKFFLECRIGIYGFLVMLLSLMAFFTAPVLVVLAPLSAAFFKTTTSLTNLHSMIGYVGRTRKHVPEYLVAEALKMTMVRGAISTLAWLLVLAAIIALYGGAHLNSFFADPLAVLKADIELLSQGRLPAIMAGALLYAPLALLIDCLLAVPMAGAAYAIAPSDRVFNGLWGIGHNFWSILASRLAYLTAMGLITLGAVTLFLPDLAPSTFIDALRPAAAGQPAPELAIEVNAQSIAVMAVLVLGNYLTQPLWLATSVLSFFDKLGQDDAAGEASRPCPEAEKANRAALSQSHADLRRQRMPARWQT